MNGEEQIVIGLLQGLGDSVEFALVAPAVVGLRLPRHGADQVGMNPHGEAYHVHGLDDIRSPVAALLVGLYLVDDDIMYDIAVRIGVNLGEPSLPAIFDTGKKFEYFLLLFDNPRLLFGSIRDSFGPEDTGPLFVGNFNVVFDGRRVLEFGLLGQANKSLDVVPPSPE